MLIRKILFCLMFLSTWPAITFAGQEDWYGTFLIQNPDGSQFTVTHTPTYFEFLSFGSRGCLSIGKGVRFNGITVPQDVKFCANYNIEKFTSEVQKFGFILNQSTHIGPTYYE